MEAAWAQTAAHPTELKQMTSKPLFEYRLQDPLSEVTRKQRRALLAVSTLAIFITETGVAVVATLDHVGRHVVEVNTGFAGHGGSGGWMFLFCCTLPDHCLFLNHSDPYSY